MRILHSADWHIEDSVIEEAEKCLDFLVETAFNERPDLIVIAGDIFNRQDVKMDSLSAKLAGRIVSELADIAPVLICIGTPSHDGLAAELFKFIPRVHVSTMPEQIFLQAEDFVEIDSVAEYGGADAIISVVPTPTKQFMQGTDEEISQAMSGIFAGFGASAYASGVKGPHILVGHFNVSGSKLPTGQIFIGKDIEISIDQMMMAEPDLICLGHIHQEQQLGDRTYYSGSLFPLNWGEMQEHGFYIHEITPDTLPGLEDDEITDSRFIETPHKRMIRLSADFTNGEDEEDFDMILYSYGPEELSGSFVRFDFKVWQDEVEKIDRESVISFFKSAGALDVDIRINRIPRENVRAEAVLKAETLREKLVRQAELRGETVDESILLKADSLEAVQADELIQMAAGGGAV